MEMGVNNVVCEVGKDNEYFVEIYKNLNQIQEKIESITEIKFGEFKVPKDREGMSLFCLDKRIKDLLNDISIAFTCVGWKGAVDGIKKQEKSTKPKQSKGSLRERRKQLETNPEKHKLPSIGDMFVFYGGGYRNSFFAKVSKITKASIAFTVVFDKIIDREEYDDGRGCRGKKIPDENACGEEFLARKTSFGEDGYVECTYQNSLGHPWDNVPLNGDWHAFD